MFRRVLLGGVVVLNLFGLTGLAFAQTAAPLITTSPIDQSATTTDITDTAVSPAPAVSLPVLTTALPKTSQPFYTDMRYIILIIDGLLVIGMIMTVVGRVLGSAIKAQTPYESQVVAEQPAAVAKPKQQGPVTLDELNIDLPL